MIINVCVCVYMNRKGTEDIVDKFRKICKTLKYPITLENNQKQLVIRKLKQNATPRSCFILLATLK